MLGLSKSWWQGYIIGWAVSSVGVLTESGSNLDRALGRLAALLWTFILFIVLDRLFLKAWREGRA